MSWESKWPYPHTLAASAAAITGAAADAARVRGYGDLDSHDIYVGHFLNYYINVRHLFSLTASADRCKACVFRRLTQA